MPKPRKVLAAMSQSKLGAIALRRAPATSMAASTP
jgi:hypothetical protein